MTGDNLQIVNRSNVGSTVGPIQTLGFNHYWPNYSPVYTLVGSGKNKIEQAFEVASMLIAKGHIGEIALKDFIKLVGEIAGEL